MPIIESNYDTSPPDTAGRYQVVERHIDHTGRELMVTYTCEPHWNPAEVMEMRATKLGEEIDRREAQDLEAANFVIPWSRKDFWLRVTPEEYAACKALTATDHVADYYFEVLRSADPIYPGNPVLVAGLTYFETAGKLAAGRANEIAGVA